MVKQRTWGWMTTLVACGIVSWSVFQLQSGEKSKEQSVEKQIPLDAELIQDSPLIVHEWGTFTSFSGSDGVKLEFRPLVDNDLPNFVFNRVKHSGWVFTKTSIRAIQRMETPVTYFYTDVERDVNVSVDFPDGLLTEFYPPVRELAPKHTAANGFSSAYHDFALKASDAAKVPELKNSSLNWGELHLIPLTSLQAKVEDPALARRFGRHMEQTMVPDSMGVPHYQYARDTDSAIVQMKYRHSSENISRNVAQADYFEKFLFYRGVGNFDLPLEVQANQSEEFSITNSGERDIRSLFLVNVNGKEIQFLRHASLSGGESAILRLPQETRSVDELTNEVVKALIAEGLYEKEASAMVRTWRSSWFGEQGTRLFYMVPQSMTDELLPLHISPQPDEMVRVLVGRMEIMTPSQEQQVAELVRKSAHHAKQANPDRPHLVELQAELLDTLLAMGRLAEPALTRVRHISNEPSVRDEARRLITKLREHHENAE